MALKTGIFSLALGALLVGTAAQANDAYTQQHFASGAEVHVQGHPGGFGVHVHTSRCNHTPQPAPPQNQHGRYELKLVQKWVPGYYQQVWVPEDCKYHPRRNVKKCRGGYYEQQWVPGRYETVEQWVWVPMEYRRHHGAGRATPANHWN
jgi:hypothetical protein